MRNLALKDKKSKLEKGLGPATLLKKTLRHMYFSVNFAKFLTTHPVASSVWFYPVSCMDGCRT